MSNAKLALAGVIFLNGCLQTFQAQTANPLNPGPHPLSWLSDLPSALREAERENKMVFLVVEIPWSSESLRMETETFGDSKVQRQLETFILVKLNANSLDKAQKSTYRLRGSQFESNEIRILDLRGAVAASRSHLRNSSQLLNFLERFQDRFRDDFSKPFQVRWNVSSTETRRYTFSLTEAEIRDSPVWPMQDGCPPLPPRRAVQLAQAKLDTITKNNWRFESIRLEPVGPDGHWIYRVIFQHNPPPNFAGGLSVPGGDSVPVVMNGYIPQPALTSVDEGGQ